VGGARGRTPISANNETSKGKRTGWLRKPRITTANLGHWRTSTQGGAGTETILEGQGLQVGLCPPRPWGGITQKGKENQMDQTQNFWLGPVEETKRKRRRACQKKKRGERTIGGSPLTRPKSQGLPWIEKAWLLQKRENLRWGESWGGNRRGKKKKNLLVPRGGRLAEEVLGSEQKKTFPHRGEGICLLLGTPKRTEDRNIRITAEPRTNPTQNKKTPKHFQRRHMKNENPSKEKGE